MTPQNKLKSKILNLTPLKPPSHKGHGDLSHHPLSKPSKRPRVLSNASGQSVIEYLIIVALMGIASVAIMRTLNHAVKNRYAHIVTVITNSKHSVGSVTLKKSDYEKSDLGNFMNGAKTRKQKNSTE